MRVGGWPDDDAVLAGRGLVAFPTLRVEGARPRRFEILVGMIGAGLVVLGPDDEVCDAVAASTVEGLLGRMPESAAALVDLVVPEDRAGVASALAVQSHGVTTAATPIRFRPLADPGRWLAGTVHPVDGGHERALVLRDVTDQVAMEHRLAELALTDELTGLPNRRHLFDRLEQALARLERHPGVVGVVVVDLDGFKEVNDRFGHAAGDAVLRRVAAELVAVVRPSDTVARLGGDEFVVLCEDAPGTEGAREIAGRLRGAVLARMELPDGSGPVEVRASVGARATDDPVIVPASLLAAADRAMYVDKRNSRARRRSGSGR